MHIADGNVCIIHQGNQRVLNLDRLPGSMNNCMTPCDNEIIFFCFLFLNIKWSNYSIANLNKTSSLALRSVHYLILCCLKGVLGSYYRIQRNSHSIPTRINSITNIPFVFHLKLLYLSINYVNLNLSNVR